MVVATIETFQPSYADIEEYTVKMFENRGRGIGDKGKDNGLLVLLAVKDRRVWAEVGYDLEQFITDGYAGEVSRNDMAPLFCARRVRPRGCSRASRASSDESRRAAASRSPVYRCPRRRAGPGSGMSPWVIVAIIVIVMLMNNAGGRRSRLRRGGSHWGGGSWSGWNSGVGPFGGGGRIGGGGFGGGFGGFGGGRSGGGGGGASW